MQAYRFECEPYDPGAAGWLDPSLPVSSRVSDLVARLSAPQLVAQLIHSGGDVYARNVQLPRYIVSQECLAGYDGGPIFISPPVGLCNPHTHTHTHEHKISATATTAAATTARHHHHRHRHHHHHSSPYHRAVAGCRSFPGACAFGLRPPKKKVATTVSSAFPQPVNLGASWDAALVREVASAISDEARAAFNHRDRPSLTCMSPNL